MELLCKLQPSFISKPPCPLRVCVPAVNSKMSSYKKTLQSLRGDYQRAVEKQEREGLLGGREAVSRPARCLHRRRINVGLM